jgi:hypothetical protein
MNLQEFLRRISLYRCNLKEPGWCNNSQKCGECPIGRETTEDIAINIASARVGVKNIRWDINYILAGCDPYTARASYILGDNTQPTEVAFVTKGKLHQVITE